MLLFSSCCLIVLGMLRLYAHGEQDWVGWLQLLGGAAGVGSLAAVMALTRNGWSR